MWILGCKLLPWGHLRVSYCCVAIVCSPVFPGGVEPPTNFSKRGEFDMFSIFRGRLLGKREVTLFGGGEVQFLHEK